jgi:two-component system OmpR family response regulator
MPTEAHLLLVDDDPNLVELLSSSLRFAGFEVTTAMNGHQALDVAAVTRPDVILLDEQIPGVDRLTVGRIDRGNPPPLLILAAAEGAGLSSGDHDYVTKPFSLDEVLARVRAILLRVNGSASEPASAPLRFADIELDDGGHEVRKAGRTVSLSPTEFKLLRYFLLNPGRVLSKAALLDQVWNYDFAGDTGVVESYVSYLRRKVDTTQPRLLHTLRGVGYVLR